MPRVMFIGDRWWGQVDPIHEILVELTIKYGDDLVIVSGGARGADTLSEAVAKGMGIPVEVFKADWDGQGKKAGPLRNQAMIETEPVLIMVFHNNLTRSKGTMDTIRRAARANIHVQVYPDNEFNRRALQKVGANRVQTKLGDKDNQSPEGTQATE